MQGTVTPFKAELQGARREFEDRCFSLNETRKDPRFTYGMTSIVLADGHQGTITADSLTNHMRQALEQNTEFGCELPTPVTQASQLECAFYHASQQPLAGDSGSTLTAASVCWSLRKTTGIMDVQVAMLQLGDSRVQVIDPGSGELVRGEVVYYHDYAGKDYEAHPGVVGEERLCEAIPHSFADEKEKARYTTGLAAVCAQIQFEKKRGTLACEDRIQASVKAHGRIKWDDQAEPPRRVSASYVPAKISELMEQLQCVPEVTVFRFQRQNSGFAVVACCDGMDSKCAVTNIPKVLSRPIECEYATPPVLAQGLKGIAECYATQGKYDGPIPQSPEWIKAGATTTSTAFIRPVLVSLKDHEWLMAVNTSEARINEIKQEFPEGLKLEHNPDAAAELACHLAVCHGSDDNVTIVGVVVQ